MEKTTKDLINACKLGLKIIEIEEGLVWRILRWRGRKHSVSTQHTFIKVVNYMRDAIRNAEEKQA